MSRTIERFCRGAAIGMILLVASPAADAQGVPVIDGAAVAQAVDNVQALTQQVQQLNAMLTQVQGIVKTVGQNGLPTLLFQQTLSQSGISNFAPPVLDLLSSAQATAIGLNSTIAAGLPNVLAQAAAAKGQNAGFANPDFSSFSSAQAWVADALTVPPNASVTAIGLTRKARNMLAGEAAANAYAMALNARQQVSQMADRAKQLAAQASSATDLRGDVAANTAVMLAMHDEIAELQALMAAMLEVQSSARLADSDPVAGSAAAAPAAAGAN